MLKACGMKYWLSARLACLNNYCVPCRLVCGLFIDGEAMPHRDRLAYLSTIAPIKQKRAVARLHLTAAPIQTNQTHAVLFSQRRCTRCNRGVDTEHHLLFDCPALASTRAKFQNGPPLAGRSMRALMSGVYDDD